MPTNASRCTSTSASTNTITSPVARRTPSLRAPAADELRRVLDDDDLVGREVGAGDRVEAAFERDGPVGSGNDGGEGHHGAGIIWLAAP